MHFYPNERGQEYGKPERTSRGPGCPSGLACCPLWWHKQGKTGLLSAPYVGGKDISWLQAP